MSNDKIKASEDQIIYANILNIGMWLGFVILTATFLLYVFKIVPSHVPIENLEKYWSMKVGDYLYVASQVEQGKEAEAVALLASCKQAAADGQKPAECKEIAEQSHKMAGWSWLHRVGKGDYLNFVGIAVLAGLTIVCYLAIIPSFQRKQDKAFLMIAIAEVLVLTLAASGILKGGGH